MKEGKILYEWLLKNNFTITFAESCTGGLASHLLTNIPGASRVFNFSVVTYANEAKTAFLGVDEQILTTQGAVSKACVEAMAQGIAKVAKSNLSIAISGLAGPTGATSKPIGLVYFGYYLNGQVFSTDHQFHGSRRHIQRSSAKFSYYYLIKEIIKLKI
ncbi:MAG: CinA family protein [Acholeplasmatales bacterium]|jgi:PncC family amidohydrolase|nr:CinA family protein [Acholeplasmatales bacterium]